MLTIVTAHAQESVVNPTAFEEIIKLLLNKGGQSLFLCFELGTKRGVIRFDESIEKCFFWPMYVFDGGVGPDADLHHLLTQSARMPRIDSIGDL